MILGHFTFLVKEFIIIYGSQSMEQNKQTGNSACVPVVTSIVKKYKKFSFEEILTLMIYAYKTKEDRRRKFCQSKTLLSFFRNLIIAPIGLCNY